MTAEAWALNITRRAWPIRLCGAALMAGSVSLRSLGIRNQAKSDRWQYAVSNETYDCFCMLLYYILLPYIRRINGCTTNLHFFDLRFVFQICNVQK